MEDESAGRYPKDRQRSAVISAENGKRISFNPQILGKLFHRLEEGSAEGS
jgi:hypothetical protein